MKKDRATPILSDKPAETAPEKPIRATPIVTVVDSSHLVKQSSFEPNEGELHIVVLDAQGVEVPGSDFSITEKQYLKSYQHPKFRVKKNPSQNQK